MKYIIVDKTYKHIAENKGNVPELFDIGQQDLFISKEQKEEHSYFHVGRINNRSFHKNNVEGLASFNSLVHAEIFCKALIIDLENDPICPMFDCDNKKIKHYCEEHADRED